MGPTAVHKIEPEVVRSLWPGAATNVGVKGVSQDLIQQLKALSHLLL